MARRAVSETMIPINQVNLFSPENTDEENALEAIETLKEWGCFASLLAYKPLRDKYRWWHLDSTLRNWFEEPKALKEFAKALGPDNDDFVPNAIATQALVELSIELTPFSDNRDAAWRLWKTLLHFAEEFEFGLQRDELITGEDEVFLDAARGGRMIARFLDADGWLEKVVNGRVPLPPSTRLRKQHYVVPDGDQQSAGMAMASVIRQNVVTSLINASFGRQIVDPEAYYDPTPANAVVLANLRALVGYERSSYFEDQFDQAEFESDREVEYQEAARNFVERLLDEVFPVGDQTRSRWMLIADLETFSVR
jgi:hypothetical protein